MVSVRMDLVLSVLFDQATVHSRVLPRLAILSLAVEVSSEEISSSLVMVEMRMAP